MNTREFLRSWRHLPELAFEDATAFLARLTREPAYMEWQILPLLGQVESAGEPSIAATFGTRDASTCLQIFLWPAGAMTPIHDHTGWGAYHCVVGSLLEERYRRLDDQEPLSAVRLGTLWRRMWSRTDGASTVQPYGGGIHRIANPGRRPAISVHLYGPRAGVFNGRAYDMPDVV